ncbi:inorganic pyrophosphatase [Echinococcus multilocularis]|uniref:Inorganic pyrophosphatase n=1 Tax=Echinococcus multilocularis TaxID=6211 RepID=A0A068Y611_ECHMU|nr:inorganic pyrophosphatase [Echinococcus multilocularis]
MSTFTTKCFGESNSTEYRMYFFSKHGPISPFHDINLHHDSSNTFNMVVEIPRWTNAKMEICKEELLNPIKQDVKKGKLRYVDNVFPHKGYIWNYGALPQTYEDPAYVDPNTEAKGDNDPIDVCEIGNKIIPSGSIIQVKVLGILAMIDEGETDWKVIAINVEDPLAEKLSDIKDVEHHMPGFLDATRDWFRNYKVPTGKPKNSFAFNEQYKDKEFALKIIAETHEQWKHLVLQRSESSGLFRQNVTHVASPYHILLEEAEAEVAKLPPFKRGKEVSDPAVEEIHFVPG